MVDIKLELGQGCQALDWQVVLKDLPTEHHSPQRSLLWLKPARGQVKDQEVDFAFEDQIRDQVLKKFVGAMEGLNLVL